VLIDGLSDTINREVTVQLVKNSGVILEYGFATNVGATNRGSASFEFTTDLLVGDVVSVRLVADGLMAYSLNMLQFTLISNKLEV
jgi:hypothetical protein